MFSEIAATPWNIPSAVSATVHLAMTEPPPLTGPAMSAYLDGVRSLNCGNKPEAHSVRSATLFSPFALLFDFKPADPTVTDFSSSALVAMQTGGEWAGGLTAFRDRDDSFFLRPGDVRERTFVANIGLALLAAGHIPNMSLALDRVREDDLSGLYLTAEEEVRKTRVSGDVNGRGSHGAERSRFDLLGMECEHCASAQTRRLEKLCSLIVSPPRGQKLGYSFRFPESAQDPRWRGMADLCAELLAVGAARLIGLDHDYTPLNTSIPHDDRMTVVTRQFGDAWLVGMEVLFNPPHLPVGQKWAPPAIRIGGAPALPLIYHQFQPSPEHDRYVGRFAVAHRLDLRPGYHGLDLHVSLHGKEVGETFNYAVPERQ